jgi:hypothetical protein
MMIWNVNDRIAVRSSKGIIDKLIQEYGASFYVYQPCYVGTS